MFFDNVHVENQKMLSVSSTQTFNRFMFETIIGVVKKLKKELKLEYKKK